MPSTNRPRRTPPEEKGRALTKRYGSATHETSADGRCNNLELKAAIGKLEDGGYKATPQRQAVLGALAAEQHKSLEEIRMQCPEVGLVTVYRTLDLLGQLGIVRRLDLGDGVRYEFAKDHHHHMICESCGDILDFEECPLDPALLHLKNAEFEIRSHSLEVYGRCVACR